jgi:hypothetical protein
MIPVKALTETVKTRLEVGSLTKWEDTFLKSIIEQVARGKSLSDKQMNKLSDLLRTAPSKPVVTRPGDST